MLVLYRFDLPYSVQWDLNGTQYLGFGPKTTTLKTKTKNQNHVGGFTRLRKKFKLFSYFQEARLFRSDEGLTPEASEIDSLYGGQFTFSLYQLC